MPPGRRDQHVRRNAGARRAPADRFAGAVRSQVQGAARDRQRRSQVQAPDHRPQLRAQRRPQGGDRARLRRGDLGRAQRQGRDRAVRPRDRARQAADPRAARGRRGQQRAGRIRHAPGLQHRRRDRHRARSASLRLPRRLRRERDLSVSRLRLAVRNGAQRPGQEQGARDDGAELSQGHQQGPLQDHLEDGHQHHLLVSRRPAVRSRGPARRSDRDVLQRHGLAHPGRQVRGSAGRAGSRRRDRLERAQADRAGRPLQVRARRRISRLQPRRRHHAPARGEVGQVRGLSALFGSREHASGLDDPRPVRVQGRTADSDR